MKKGKAEPDAPDPYDLGPVVMEPARSDESILPYHALLHAIESGEVGFCAWCARWRTMLAYMQELPGGVVCSLICEDCYATVTLPPGNTVVLSPRDLPTAAQYASE